MNRRFLSPILFLVAAILFAALGLRSVPRNNLHIILAIVFALIAATRFRRVRS
jgi:hypothetical protein